MTKALKSDWFVVYTYPQSERKVVDRLTRDQIEAYSPLHTVVRQWSDRKKKVSLPLFPNYVFVNIPDIYRYRVLSVSGVTRFVSFEGKPVTLTDKDINSMRLLVSGEWELSNEEIYHEGDHVRVIHGPLSGLEGSLVDRRGSKRFCLRFNSFDKIVSVDIHTSCLEKIEDTPAV